MYMYMMTRLINIPLVINVANVCGTALHSEVCQMDLETNNNLKRRLSFDRLFRKFKFAKGNLKTRGNGRSVEHLSCLLR